jgi:hypothetical protein
LVVVSLGLTAFLSKKRRKKMTIRRLKKLHGSRVAYSLVMHKKVWQLGYQAYDGDESWGWVANCDLYDSGVDSWQELWQWLLHSGFGYYPWFLIGKAAARRELALVKKENENE